MNLKQYLSITGLGTAASFAAWFIILIAINPLTAGFPAFFVFYLTLFTALSGLFTFLGTFIRSKRDQAASLQLVVARSLRQGVFLSIFFIISLYLIGIDSFSLPIFFMLLGVIGLIEFFFLSMKDSKHVEEG